MTGRDWQNTFPKLIEGFKGTGVIVGLRSGSEFEVTDMWGKGQNLAVFELAAKKKAKTQTRYLVTSYDEVSYIVLPGMHDDINRNRSVDQ